MTTIFLGEERIEVFLSLYTNHTALAISDLGSLAIPIYCFEITIHILNIFLIYAGCKLFAGQQLLHVNLSRILFYYMFQYYSLIIARCIISTYQFGILSLTYTVNGDLPILTGSWILFFGMGACPFSIASVAIERVCATVFVVDYEFNRRKHIGIIIIIINIASSAVFATLMLKHYLNVYVSVTFLSVTLVIPFTLFCWIYRTNFQNEKKIFADFEVYGKYSVSLRFQIHENLLAVRFMRNVVMAGSGTILLAILAYCLPRIVLIQFSMNDPRNPIKNIFSALFEAIGSAMATVIVITAYLTLNSLPETCPIRCLRRSQRKRAVSVIHCSVLVGSNGKRTETDVYFQQLQNAWALPIENEFNSKS